MVQRATWFSSLVVVLSLTVSSQIAHAETRTWTDVTGKFKIEGEFVGIVEGQVKLQRTDGKKVSLPLAKLSKDDQAYLKEEVKRRRDGGGGGGIDPANPFQADSGGIGGAPNMGRGMSGAHSRMRDAMRRRGGGFGDMDEDEPQFNEGDEVEVKPLGDKWQRGVVSGFSNGPFERIFVRLEDGSMVEARGDDIRPYDPSLGELAGVTADQLTRVNLKGIRRILPLGDSGKFAPDPAPAGSLDWEPKPVALSPKSDHSEHVAALSFARGGAQAALAHQQHFGRNSDQSRIEFADLKTGRVTEVRGPRDMELIALSPSGKRVATISKAETFTHGPLQLWETGGKDLKHLFSWQATGDDRRDGKIEWLGWLDEARLMTIDRNGLTVWNVESQPRGDYQIAGSGMKAPAFSPGGKQFAVGTDKGMSIHDAASGELLSRIAMDHSFNRQVAFSPSGKLLASMGMETVEVYDATTGQEVMEAYAGNSRPDRGICWLDEEHVLVGGQELIHLPSQMTVWTYENHAESVVPLAGRVWYVINDHPTQTLGLLPFKLPHAAVKPVQESELALKPGDEVSLNLELSYDMTGPNGESAEDQLRKALTAAGFKVVDNSSKQLIGRATPGETKEIAYRMFGAGFGEPQKASYQERVFELDLLVDGASVWKRRRVLGAPFHIQLNKDESVDQAIQRLQAADTGFFRSTVPSRLLPTEAEKARTSRLTINGME